MAELRGSHYPDGCRLHRISFGNGGTWETRLTPGAAARRCEEILLVGTNPIADRFLSDLVSVHKRDKHGPGENRLRSNDA
jgi:hypothetical protein